MTDLLVLGGGPAGYCAAERAAGAGLSVVLFEERALGGVCLNEGCIPTKTLLHSAKLCYAAAHGGGFGVRTGEVSLDHGVVMGRKQKVVRTLTAGVGSALKAAGVTVVKARGKVTGRVDETYRVEAGGETFEGRRLLIATGSAPLLPPIPGLENSLRSGCAVTSREALALAKVPPRLVIVGGGVIGLEMALYYQAAGSEVTVLELLSSVGGALDAEIADPLQKALQGKGIRIETGARVTEVGEKVSFERNGLTESVPADVVLLSLGRRPVLKDLGLESLSLETAPSGIPTDRFQQTNLPGLYAAGDVTGKMLLAHVAYRQGEVAVRHMLGHRDDPMRYDAVPAVLYTSPEVACTGLTERAAGAAGYDVSTVTLPMGFSGRFVAENELGSSGLCKIVVERGTGRLLGIHLLGPYASEIILAASALIESGATVERAKRVIFPHPTVGEMIRECLFHWKGLDSK